MRITDWIEMGMLPFRHHVQQPTPVALRNCVMGARQGHVDNGYGPGRDQFGATVPAMLENGDGEDTKADLQCVSVWGFSAGAQDNRGMPSWAMAWPAEVSSAASGGSDPDPNATGVTGPELVLGINPTTTGAPRKSNRVLPVRKTDWRPDLRYSEKPAVFPPMIKALPVGWPVVVIAGTEERSQEDLAFPSGGILAAPYRGGRSDLGSLVFDTRDDDSLDADRAARIQSAWRVYQTPGNAAMQSLMGPTTGHGLSIQCGTPLRGFGGLGMFSDDLPGTAPSGNGRPPQVISPLSYRASGPLHPGFGAPDTHSLGVNGDADQFSAGGISTDAYFVRDLARTGPLEFRGNRYYGPYGDAEDAVDVHIDWDPFAPHKFVGGARQGMWRLWSTTHHYEPPTIREGPGTTPGGPTGGPPPWNPFFPQYPVPDPKCGPGYKPWSPHIPGHMGPECDPGTGTPGGGGATDGPAPEYPTSPHIPGELAPGEDPPYEDPTAHEGDGFRPELTGPYRGGSFIPEPPASGGQYPPTGAYPEASEAGGVNSPSGAQSSRPPTLHTLDTRQSRPTARENPISLRFLATTRESALPSILLRPQNFTPGVADLRNQSQARSLVRRNVDRTTPIVGRLESVGAQQSEGWAYTTRDSRSRYYPGTAAGALWALPAEIGMEQIVDGTVPAAYSSMRLGISQYARLAFGTPLTSALAGSGYEAYLAGGLLKVDTTDAAGATTATGTLWPFDAASVATGILAVARGGTGLGSYTAGDTLYASGATTLAKIAKGTGFQINAMNSGATAPAWISISSLLDSTLDGTRGNLILRGATVWAALPIGSNGQVVTSNGTDASWQTPSSAPANPNCVYGDGGDGAIALDGTNLYAGIFTTTGAAPNLVYTQVRDFWASTFTVSAGKTLNTNGFRQFAAVSINNAGTIQNNAVGTIPGPGGTLGGGGLPAQSLVQGPEQIEGFGGAGGNGTGGLYATGATPVWAATNHSIYNYPNSFTLSDGSKRVRGGGGAGVDNTGHAAGAGGGVIGIFSPATTNSGTIQANGGDAVGGNCGGGGGGLIQCPNVTNTGTIQALGGAKTGTGTNGSPGEVEAIAP